MREWLPADHKVWFVLEIVDRLDRSAFHARHHNAGWAAYDPDMLLGLLIYAYCLTDVIKAPETTEPTAFLNSRRQWGRR